MLEERIRLVPDESGRFLWADYALGFRALLRALLVAAAAEARTYRKANGTAVCEALRQDE